jgi:DMSO/TMAO reductase YedYZ molybdopterin-dependent catalytic subunit
VVTRRSFLGAAAMTVGATALAGPAEVLPGIDPALERLLAEVPYLTPMDQFGGFVREKPVPYELPPEKLRAAGLDRDTWRLEVVAEEGANPPESGPQVARPMTRAAGTALTFADLTRLGETRSVRFIKMIACTLVSEPFGTGIWEGVPLRDVVWLARPTANVRRVYWYGFHNDDPKQFFQSSLPVSRILEDPPGELPVILCYKYNGHWLSPRLGGPVRMIVPEGYGNKCIKWVQRIVLSNGYQSNDTYASWGNDTDSPIKTVPRFVHPAHKVKLKPGERLPIIGRALVGIAGLSKVQYSIHPREFTPAADDPYLTKLDWRDARVLGPPNDWGGDLAWGKLPEMPLQFDPRGKPRVWPIRYGGAQWAAMSEPLAAGSYTVRCRAVDSRGVAQPMPRPLPRSGDNRIQEVEVVVEG